MNLSRPRDSTRTPPEVSLVLPLYNPGERLTASLRELSQFLGSLKRPWETVFVSDGCTDNSADQLRTFAKSHSAIRIVEYTPNRGKGHAVRQGLLSASAPYRIFTDIDLAYSFDDIERVANSLREGSHVAIASRTHAQSQLVIQPQNLGYVFRRHLQSAAFGLLARTILPLKQRDTQAGLKGFTESAVRQIVPRMNCDGFGFDCEILTACARLGISVTEIPVRVSCDETTSTTNIRSTLRMVGDLFRIRKNWRTPPHDELKSNMAHQYREAG